MRSLICSILMFSAFSATASTVICKGSYSTFRLVIEESGAAKLFYTTDAAYGYRYKLDEVEVDGGLKCREKSLSPLIVDCSSESEYTIDDPTGFDQKKKLKARLTAISKTVSDESVDKTTTSVVNRLDFVIDVPMSTRVKISGIRGVRENSTEEKAFEVELNQGLKANVKCSVE